MKKLVWLIAIGIVANSFTPRKITWVAIGDSITYLNEHQMKQVTVFPKDI